MDESIIKVPFLCVAGDYHCHVTMAIFIIYSNKYNANLFIDFL